MRKKIVNLLKSTLSGERRLGWADLHDECLQNHYQLTRNDCIFLAQCIREEDDEGLRLLAIGIFLELIALELNATAPPVGAPPEAPSRRPLEYVYQWLWDPFHENSAMFGTASDVYLRDGMALVDLARRLGWEEFPRARIELVPAGQPRWEGLLHRQQFQAIFLVGRLGLFGDEAILHWGCSSSRFFFPKQQRLPGSAPDAFDPEYYCICERLEDGRIESYRAQHDEVKGKWTDFALIQRYPVEYMGVQIVVVLCAGCSSLGTLAAAQWAASHLTRNAHPDGTPIRCPQGITVNSRLEALLMVIADVDQSLWAPSRVDLLRLIIDRHTWKPLLSDWGKESLVELRCENGDPQKPIAMVIEGTRERMALKGQMFQLAVAVCLSAAENQGLVDRAKLLQSPQLWPNGDASEEKLRNRLSGLKYHHLKKLLTIESEVRLYATVKIVPAEPVAVPVGGPRRKGRKPYGGTVQTCRKPR